jgi:hypothetical protein
MMRVLVVMLLAVLSGAETAGAFEPPVTRAWVEAQLVRFDPLHRERAADREARLAGIEARLLALQAAGEPMACSAHMLNELRWLMRSTADWPRIDRQLWLLGTSLTDTDQDFALSQESWDGSWGVCYTEWFKKLDPMISAINLMAKTDAAPAHRALAFLRPIATPELLVRLLESLRVSDVAATGVNGRDALGAVTSVVAEIVHKTHLLDWVTRNVQGIELAPEYEAAFRRFVDDWQDPATGYWGPWYRDGERLLKAADLSFTYHIVAYRRGDVARWDAIVRTTLAIAGHDYPFGWRWRGRLNNHNAYDVVRIFEAGWPHLGAEAREQAAAAMAALVAWSLAETLRPDGSFEPVPGFDSSYSDAQYYGVSFLTRVGYCSAAPPFWRAAGWPEAPERCCAIAAAVERLDMGVPAARAARDRLARALPGCPRP